MCAAVAAVKDHRLIKCLFSWCLPVCAASMSRPRSTSVRVAAKCPLLSVRLKTCTDKMYVRPFCPSLRSSRPFTPWSPSLRPFCPCLGSSQSPRGVRPCALSVRACGRPGVLTLSSWSNRRSARRGRLPDGRHRQDDAGRAPRCGPRGELQHQRRPSIATAAAAAAAALSGPETVTCPGPARSRGPPAGRRSLGG